MLYFWLVTLSYFTLWVTLSYFMSELLYELHWVTYELLFELHHVTLGTCSMLASLYHSVLLTYIGWVFWWECHSVLLSRNHNCIGVSPWKRNHSQVILHSSKEGREEGSVCVCVWMYVVRLCICGHVCACVGMHGHVCACMGMCVHAWTCVCMHGHVCACVGMCVHVWTCVCGEWTYVMGVWYVYSRTSE